MKRKIFSILLCGTMIYISIFNVFRLCNNDKNIKILNSIVENEILEEDVERHKQLLDEIINKSNKRYLAKNSEVILELIEKINSLTEDYTWAIEVIESIIYDGNGGYDKNLLPYFDELRSYYLKENNYAKVSYLSVESLILSEEAGDNVAKSNALIEMAILFDKIGGSKNAIEVLKEALTIEIDDLQENADIKIYAILNISDIYLSEGKYEEAEKALQSIDLFREFFIEEDFRDIEMLKLTMEARILIYKGMLAEAGENLGRYLELEKVDKDEYYIGKDVSYNLALGKLYTAESKIDEAKDIYQYLLNYSKKKNDIYLNERMLEELINIEEDINKKSIYREELLLLLRDEQSRRYGDYTNNILDKIRYESAMIASYDSKILAYRILLIVIISIIVMSIIYIRKVKQMNYLNAHDVLTSSLNRRRFNEDFNKALKKEEEFSIIMIDIDNFKYINDTYGHKFGDIVLINVCKGIENILDKGDKLYRFGGEEFIIICNGKCGKAVYIIAEKIRKLVEDMHWKEKVTVTLSMGVSCSRNSRSNMIETADKNLYMSKNTGKNKVTF